MRVTLCVIIIIHFQEISRKKPFAFQADEPIWWMSYHWSIGKNHCCCFLWHCVYNYCINYFNIIHIYTWCHLGWNTKFHTWFHSWWKMFHVIKHFWDNRVVYWQYINQFVAIFIFHLFQRWIVCRYLDSMRWKAVDKLSQHVKIWWKVTSTSMLLFDCIGFV